MQSDTWPKTAHCAWVDAERASNPMKQPRTAHPTVTPIHHSADPIAAQDNADDHLPVLPRWLRDTVVLLQHVPEPATVGYAGSGLGGGRHPGFVHTVGAGRYIRQVETGERSVGGDATAPRRTWAYAGWP